MRKVTSQKPKLLNIWDELQRSVSAVISSHEKVIISGAAQGKMVGKEKSEGKSPFFLRSGLKSCN